MANRYDYLGKRFIITDDRRAQGCVDYPVLNQPMHCTGCEVYINGEAYIWGYIPGAKHVSGHRVEVGLPAKHVKPDPAQDHYRFGWYLRACGGDSPLVDGPKRAGWQASDRAHSAMVAVGVREVSA